MGPHRSACGATECTEQWRSDVLHDLAFKLRALLFSFTEFTAPDQFFLLLQIVVKLLTGFVQSINWKRRVCEPVGMRADEHCIETLELSLAEYESIRASPIRFPVKVGHDYPEFERMVALSDAYALVEKIGAAAEVAKDARSSLTGKRRQPG